MPWLRSVRGALGLACGLGLQRLLDDACPLLHRLAGAGGQLVRQQIGGPDEPGAIAIGEDLRRCIVMCVWAVDHRPDEPPGIIVEIDQALAQDYAVEEGDDPVLPVESRIDDEAGHQALVQSAPIAHGRPHFPRVRVDHDLLADTSHIRSVPVCAAHVLDIRARLRESVTVLSATTFIDRDGVAIADVLCRHKRGRGLTGEQVSAQTVVFIRRGCFVRSADGVERLLDPTVAYCMNPGQEQRYDHPHDQGDDCTSLSLKPGLVASLWGDERLLPSEPLPTSPEIDLEHRLLLSAARRGADPHELAERAIALSARALEQADPRRVACGRPATTRARRAAADGVREILTANPERSLPDLANELAISPHHLSRVFVAATGHTISRHRMRLRARGALERLAGGERNLARLASDLGFADQSHLCRVIRAETGRTPSALRSALATSSV